MIAPLRCGSKMLGLFEALPELRTGTIQLSTVFDEPQHVPRSKMWGSHIPPVSTFAPSQRRV